MKECTKPFLCDANYDRKITTLRTLYVHVISNSVMFPQILYDTVLYGLDTASSPGQFALSEGGGGLGLSTTARRPGTKRQKSPRSARKSPINCSTKICFSSVSIREYFGCLSQVHPFRALEDDFRRLKFGCRFFALYNGKDNTYFSGCT